MEIQAKRIVITGAGSGIGRELLRLLAAYPDVRIVAADLRAETIETLPNVTPYGGDLSQQSSVDTLFAFALETLGHIDLFIANAGFAYYEQIEGADWNHIEAIFRVNTFTPLYSLLKMREINPQRRHMVVMTASAMSFMAVPGYAIYAATKAALHRFAEAYRLEQSDNAHLMLVYPIATRTNFFQRADSAPTPFPSQTADYVAQRIVRGIQSDAREVHPSAIYIVFRYFAEIIPALKQVHYRISMRQFRQWLAQRSRGERPRG